MIDTHDHKVILPNEVGKQWDNLVHKRFINCGYPIDLALYDVIDFYRVEGTEAIRDWVVHTHDAYAKLIDAARYGCIPEEEPRYYVRIPGAFSRPTYYSLYSKNSDYYALGYGYKDCDKIRSSDYDAYKFTEEEIKKYEIEDCTKEEVKDNE